MLSRRPSRRIHLFAVWFSYAVGTFLWTGLVIYGRRLNLGLLIFMALAAVQNALALVNALRYKEDEPRSQQP
jgi:hypothetical protein